MVILNVEQNLLSYFDDSQVSESCEMRRPNSFHIAVTTSGRTVNTTSVHHDHHSGSQVAIRIELPLNVNVCNLLVSIRAENNAGLSPPSEIEVGKSQLNHDRVKLCKYCSSLFV